MVDAQSLLSNQGLVPEGIQKVIDSKKSDKATLPSTDNPYEDMQAISARIDKMLQVDKFERSLFEREWFRNILFYVGQQYIIYDKTRSWRPRALPAWFPRALTNKFAEKANDIIASIVQGRVPIRYVPATDDPESIATAEIGERLREVFYAEAEIDEKEIEIASWLTLTGNVFLMPYYDMSEEFGTNKVTNPATGEESELPIGKLRVDVVSPFEIRLDHRITNMNMQRRFVRLRRYDEDYAKELWPDFADVIKGDRGSDGDLSRYYLDVLARVTSAFNSGGGFLGGDDTGSKVQKVTAYEIYELPTEEFPEGLRAVRIGKGTDAIVEAGPLPTEYGAGIRKGQKFLNIAHIGADRVPGRFWRKTRMDDLIPLQLFRNKIEANLTLSAQRMGNGMWLKPKGSGVDIITGEPGQVIEYNPITVGGTSMAKPERIPADLSNLQPLIILMNKIDDSMERVSGTFFLQGGDAPPGVTAASALSYLGEKAQRAMSPLMREWAKGFQRFEEMALEIVRANWDDSRIRIVAGKNKKWDVEQFDKSSIQGAVNFIIDYNSMFPKSQAQERADIQQLLQMQVINPQDPETQWKILEKFGKTDLKGSIDLDVKEAVREADHFMSKRIPPRVLPLVQNSVVHLMQHSDLAKSDEFKDLPQPLQDIWLAHIKAHVDDIIARRVAFSSIGMNPDDPSLAEVSSGMAQEADVEMGQLQQVQPGQVQQATPQAPQNVSQLGPQHTDEQGQLQPDIAAKMLPSQ